MSLSFRGLLIAFPIVMLIVGGMAFFTYRSAIADFQSDAVAELRVSNDAVAENLREKLRLVEETEERALSIMERSLESGTSTELEEVFVRSEDGAFHSRSDLWSGTDLAGPIRLRGFGGFIGPPEPTGDRRAATMAAFDTIKAMANGLPEEIESLYFFSSANDLLIYAPTRQDELSFYRSAPADFDFQDAEFISIIKPANNPQGDLRCTSLQTPIYDDSGENWTTGCMLPARINGKQLGGWGISIPLHDLTDSLPEPLNGATTVIASRDGKLIHHSGLTSANGDLLAANIDMEASKDPLLLGLLHYIENGAEREVEYSEELDAYISGDRLEAPDWVVLTVLPDEALSDRAWAIAKRVIGIAIPGALLLGLILSAVFHRTIARRISKLADRTNAIAMAGGTGPHELDGDEIVQLEHAFDNMEERLDQARVRETRSFDALVDAAESYAMVLYDEHGSLVRANDGAVRLFGAEELERRGKELGEASQEPDAGPSSGQPGPEPEIFERELADGNRAWLEETLIPLSDADDMIFGWAFIAHDLTSFRSAQREIEKNLLYLELAQSSAQAGHFALDPQTMEISLSPWLMSKLGLTTPLLLLSDVPALIDESQREKTMQDIAAAIERKSEFSFETLAIGAEGDRFPALLRGTTIFDDAKEEGTAEVIGYYGILQDISDQKAAAQALLHALDEAKAEARARSDILAVISHEIRTPISGILGLIDQVRRERSETERSRALTLIENSSEALLETLDATLNRARGERERQDQKKEIFAPLDLLERVAELFLPLARRKGLAIDIEKGDDCKVLGNPGRIQQILANFVSNAIKFTSTGGVTLSCDPPIDEEGHWTFAVADTGGGIAPERMKTIFEPFSGSSPDTLGRQSGSGLGLSITRQLATELGGSVEAEARPRGGTRMVLRIPLEPVAEVAESQEPQGRIGISLAQASLAIKAEVIAENSGFAVASDSGTGAIDVFLCDDRESVEASDAPCRIFVTDEPNDGDDQHVIFVQTAELVSRLPVLLRAFGDD